MADVDAKIAKEPEILNHRMSEEFDWSDDKIIVRDAIWDHMMEANDHDTVKTEQEMKPYLSKSDQEIRDYVEANLKK